MSWEKVKLGDFLKVRENRFKPNDKAIADLKRIDKIDFSGEIFISRKSSNTDMILIKNGDLVISGINVEKGAMAVYTGQEDITATIHYSSYSFDKNLIDIDFLKSFLKSNEFKNALKEQVPGGIKTEIKPKHILPLVVYIPTDIKEQREVVRVLNYRNSKVDAITTELSYQLNLVKKLRQQLLQDAVQGKLVAQNHKDQPASELLKKIKFEKEKLISEKKLKKELPPIKPDEIPFEIPENWVWCRLGEITEIKRGKSPIYAESGISKMLNQKCVRWYELDLDHSKVISETWYNSISEDFKVKENDVLVNSTGEGTIGRSALANNEANDYVFDSHILKISSKNNQSLICYYINSNFGQSLVEKSKGAKSTKQTELGVNNLSNFIYPLPPLAEQHRIVQKLEELMEYCNDLESRIKKSESQNEKLLQQVLKEALRKELVED